MTFFIVFFYIYINYILYSYKELYEFISNSLIKKEPKVYYSEILHNMSST